MFGDVLAELAYAADFWQPKPAVAFLIGRFTVEGQQGLVEIAGFEGLKSGRDQYRTLREGVDRWIVEGNAVEFPIVGAFVSKPGSEGILSTEMARAHLSLFNIPFQAMLVMDPVSRCVALYARPPGLKFHNVALTIVNDQP